MNREERRKRERSGMSKASIMEQYRKEAYEEGYAHGMESVIEITFYLTAYTIQYKLDFGRERLQRIMKAIYNNIDAFRTGHLTPDDFDTIVEEMTEKYGIKIK